jgi:Predicted acetyltransferase
MEFIQENDRYVVKDNGQEVGEMTWTKDGDKLIVNHTFVDPSLRGQGVA